MLGQRPLPTARSVAALVPVIREAVLDALAVILPVECAGCGAPDRALCAECRARIVSAPVAREIAAEGGSHDGSPLVVVSALRYEGHVRRIILGLKQNGRTDVVRALAPALVAAVAAFSTPPGLLLRLVPVPSSRAGWRRRGYDPVRMLVAAAGLDARPALRAGPATSAQKSLGVSARQTNVRGSIRARQRLDGCVVLLVDDVVTTGATLLEAARAVRDAGGEVAGAVTLASTPRRDRASDNGFEVLINR